MTKIYACLLGNWVCLNDDPDCKFSDCGKSPYLWWEEGAPIYTALQSDDDDTLKNNEVPNKSNSFYYQNYVNIVYLGKRYRINPAFIQIVNE